MPQHHPEDRVRVRNIVAPAESDVQTFFLTRYRKVQSQDINGQPKTVQTPYEQEVEWDFRDGFFFMWGGKAYVLRPGEEKSYPRFLADHCAKQQIQYVLNDLHQASRRLTSEGIAIYDKNILNNHGLKRKYLNEIVVGVEEWYEGTDDDFDAIVNKKFGGDIEQYLNEGAPANREDFELKEEVIDDGPAETAAPRRRGRTADANLQKIRDEAEAFSVEFEDSDTAEQVKERIMKAMA